MNAQTGGVPLPHLSAPRGASIIDLNDIDWDPIHAEHYGQRLHGRTNRPDT